MPWSNNGGDGSGNQSGNPWQKPKNNTVQGPWGQKTGNSGGGGGNNGGGGDGPNLGDSLQDLQNKLKQGIPGGGLGLVSFLVLGVIGWLLTGFYTVRPDELGINMVFGKYVGKTQPGLSYNWPYPIGNVMKPKVTSVNTMQIGIRSGDTARRGGLRPGQDDSLMLTGDERIVDIDFTVFWKIVEDKPESFVFNIYRPEASIRAVAEAAMREVVGRYPLGRIVSGAASRAQVEQDVQALMQRVLDTYGAGVRITGISLQTADVPAQVIEQFRDVNAAEQDFQREQNTARTYEATVIPQANAQAAQTLRAAEAYREATVAEAKGQTSRFLNVYEQYKKSPDVTRQRLFLETMERVMGSMDKVIIDQQGAGGVVPYLPLNELTKKAAPAGGVK